MKPETLSPLSELLQSLGRRFEADDYMKKQAEGKVKHHSSLSGVFCTICSSCVLDRMKEVLGIQYPELLQVRCHDFEDDGSFDENFIIDRLAALSLKEVLVKEKSPLICGDNYEVQPVLDGAGAIFVGLEFKHMKPAETLTDFKIRAFRMLMELGLVFAVDPYGEGVHKQVEVPEEAVSDIAVTTFIVRNVVKAEFLSPEFDGEEDDFDRGVREGTEDGFNAGAFTCRVALWNKFMKGQFAMKDGVKFSDLLEDLITQIERYDKSEKTFKKDAETYIEFVKKEDVDEIF